MAEKTTVAVSEQTQSPATGGQSFVTANQKKEDNALQNMDVKQRISHLRVKQFRGIATNAEQEQLKNLEEQEKDKALNFKRNNDLKKQKPKEYEEPKDIFKEDDILNYMYNEWLLGGANWLFKKTYKYTAIAADKCAENILYPAVRGLFSSKEQKPNDTTRFVNNTDKTYENFHKGSIKGVDDGLAKFEAKIDRFCRGEGSDEEKKTLMYQTIQNMTPEKRLEFQKDVITSARNGANNVKAINYMAATLSRTQLVQNAMSEENPSQTDPQLFAEMTKRNAMLIAQQLDASDNPTASMEEMTKKIEAAAKRANKSMQKGKYKGNPDKSKDPLTNTALQEINQTLGLNEKGQPDPNAQTNTPAGKGTMFQRLVQFQSTARALSAEDEAIRADITNYTNDEAGNQKRRRDFQARIQSMKIADHLPDHLRKRSNNNDNIPVWQTQNQQGGR